jgi:uncharacterized protein
MAGAAGGAHLTPLVSSRVLMLILAALMLIVALNMLFVRNKDADPKAECKPARCLLAGLGVGIFLPDSSVSAAGFC